MLSVAPDPWTRGDACVGAGKVSEPERSEQLSPAIVPVFQP